MTDRRLPVREVGEDALPVVVGPRSGGLGDVAHHGHRPVQRPTVQHPQVHRREVLDLVDHDVPVGPHLVAGLVAGPGTQYGAGLVQQGRIRCRPVHVVGRLAAGPEQGIHLAGGEAPVGGPDQGPRSEQVVQQLGWREDGPHPLEGLAHRQLAADPLAHRLRVEVAAARGDQRLVELGLHELPGRVVRPVPASGLAHDAAGLLDGQGQPLQPVAQPQVGPQATLPGTGRTGDEPDHAKVALEAPHLGHLPTVVDADAAHHVAQGGQRDPGLAERREDLFDIGEEQPVGADDQHALALQREAVRVEQVGGPVERHHRLAGTGSTLDGVHARHRRPDDVVLLGLDGADDVAEATGTGRLEGCDQRTLALQAVAVAVAEPFEVAEQLVLEAQHGASAAHDVAAALQAHGYRSGGPVEGLGHRGPPVHHDRFLVLVPDADPADVEHATPGLGLLVDPPEDQ